MIINNVSTVGCNNQVKQATNNAKFGFNKDVSRAIKKKGWPRLMDGGKLKVNPPNLINKKAVEKKRKKRL